jgi:CDP-glucose 4,6-dehydratase
VRIASPIFWKDKQVLLTGHTGFKGAWLAFWLSQMGAKVAGISLAPSSTPNLFTLANIAQMTNSHFADIRDADAVSNIAKKAQPEIVLHLAAQALVRPGYRDPLGTFATNIMGTANVLNATRGVNSVKAIVAVTTDKVYKNLETGRAYKEDDQLGGYDPYSASKAASEIIISSYRDSYLAEQGVAIASARAGNVIGGGDWSEDRLIPDAVLAWDSDLPLEIRRPNAIRPWQHVLEPLNGYLVLAEKLYTDLSFSGAYNFGPKTNEAATVKTVIELANKAYGCGSVLWGDGTEGPHEANLLSLEILKARELLGITPRWNLTETIKLTMGWYQQQRSGVSAHLLCDADIAAFSSTRKLD